MRNARLDEVQVGIKVAGRNINYLRYADNTTLMAESEEELKSILMKVKEENGKAALKSNIQKTKIMASSPITSWQIDRETTDRVRLFSWAPKSLQMVTEAMKLKDACFLKALTNLNIFLKSRDITLPMKVHIVKARVFLVVIKLDHKEG